MRALIAMGLLATAAGASELPNLELTPIPQPVKVDTTPNQYQRARGSSDNPHPIMQAQTLTLNNRVYQVTKLGDAYYLRDENGDSIRCLEIAGAWHCE